MFQSPSSVPSSNPPSDTSSPSMRNVALPAQQQQQPHQGQSWHTLQTHHNLSPVIPRDRHRLMDQMVAHSDHLSIHEKYQMSTVLARKAVKIAVHRQACQVPWFSRLTFRLRRYPNIKRCFVLQWHNGCFSSLNLERVSGWSGGHRGIPILNVRCLRSFLTTNSHKSTKNIKSSLFLQQLVLFFFNLSYLQVVAGWEGLRQQLSNLNCAPDILTQQSQLGHWNHHPHCLQSPALVVPDH